MINRLSPSLFAALVTPHPRRRLVNYNHHTPRPESPCLHPWRVLFAAVARVTAILSVRGRYVIALRHTATPRPGSASQPSESLPVGPMSRRGPGSGAEAPCLEALIGPKGPVDNLWITCGKPYPVPTLYQQFIHRSSPENLLLSTSYPQLIHRQIPLSQISPTPLDNTRLLCHTIGCGPVLAKSMTRCCIAYCY